MSTADCVSSPCFFLFKTGAKIVFGTRRVESFYCVTRFFRPHFLLEFIIIINFVIGESGSPMS